MSTCRMGLSLLAALLGAACSQTTSTVARHSSSMALSLDGQHLYDANADADSVSIINTATRQLEREILLASASPAVDANGNYAPHVQPRAVVLSPKQNRLYVTGERSSLLYTIDLKQDGVVHQVEVGSEPAGVVVSPDESRVYVACSNDSSVVAVDTGSGKVVGTAQVPAKPWALGWSANSKTLYVTHLLGPGVTEIDPGTMKVKATWTIPDQPQGDDSRVANGQVRGLYDVAVRPGTDELWVPHLMLDTTTAEPALVFENTVFPTLSILHETGSFDAHLSTNAQDVPGINGAFGDIVSGPHALQFTADGRYALVVDSASEDILVVDAVSRVEAALLRPLPGHLPEGLVLSPDGHHAYVDERNSGDVAVIDIDTTGPTIQLAVDGEVVSRYRQDPMPMLLREGQHLFHSANSDELPLTQNHWVACASCHIEGRSDAVTWRFFEGPRDTPSNAGGTIGTGLLMHTGDRRSVQDYWRTINIEQGGQYSMNDPLQAGQLAALQAYVDHAIPVPVPPHTDASLVAKGKAIFERADVGCAACHSGPLLTDSGAGNPNLDLSGPVMLHDVGTCDLTGTFPDVQHTDDDGHPRDPCQFDTPALRGLADSAPYFHDGSARTLRDVLEQTRGKMGNINVLSAEEENALIEYLRSL